MLELNNYKSVVATNNGGKTTDRFAFIPTTRVIDILEKADWVPAKIAERRCNKEENRGFQNHLIRFRRKEDLEIKAVVGEMIPEIIVKNAHDGSSCFNIMAGLFRFVCGNGMIIADSTFATHRIKHIGFQDENVIDAVSDIVKTTPLIANKVSEFKEIIISKPEQLAFAEAALLAKYGKPEQGTISEKFNLESLILPVRRSDRFSPDKDAYGLNAENSLWNSFNVLQEKLVEKGGRFARNNYRTKRARAITSVSENVRVNQALWSLTEKMAELKSN
jgi:hypothetical protein